MSSELWIISLVASVCMLQATAANISLGTLQDVLSELKNLRTSNELRDQKIEDLERQVLEDRRQYEHQFARQAGRIAELELQLSETQRADNPDQSPKKSEEQNTAYGLGVPSEKRIRQIGFSPGVAFTAYISKNVSNLGHEFIIPFDSVILNAGKAFSTNTHQFTCPVTGVYTFQTALLSQSEGLSITEIVKEGNQLVQAHAESRTTGPRTYDQGFNSVVSKCNKGERVWVRNFQHFGSGVYSERYTTFTGYLLWEAEDAYLLG
ncbi:uncharacterized protein LOC123555685 [Mercenaria mercenaria]|uniref:uncharacterized protein LOC123555685 n=1 Tax=Mercenaria mercenaria TaxID=6596 RepID=UPI00234E9A32|nr:uncharacterized protein LOC123555685 [Mercenaria mercenaria]